MIGLFIGLGVGVLIGKAAMRHRQVAGFGGWGRRHHGWRRHHGGCHHGHRGHHGFDGPPPPPFGRPPFDDDGPRFGFGPFGFWRDAPPAVRTAFKDAAYEVKRNARDARGVFGDLANAFEQENFSVEEMGESIETVRSAAEEAASAFVGALAKVHPDLSRRERAEIADLLRRMR